MKKRQAGLTLIELLIGLVVMAVLLVIAVPSFQTLRQQYTVRSAGMAIYADLQLARSEAIKRNKDITVCFSGSESVNWEYQIKNSTDCSGSVIEEIKASHYPSVSLKFPYAELTFRPRRNTLSPGSIIASNGTQHMSIITSNYGRIRTCSDDQLIGVPKC
ncbi:GspH/FimT family pseudopilin [Oceanisphaera sediminis]|uniref:Type II secretion system protein H n=1 Tax=Oceanisphaera sediminis TaxID=981381 RepID=A0ABP7DVU8_9GAMM